MNGSHRRPTWQRALATALVVPLVAVGVAVPRPAWAASIADELTASAEEQLAYVEENGANSGADWSEAQWHEAPLVSQADESSFPERFDLRDRGIVTPIKLQNPWGSCWSFGALAAAETSILNDLGLTYGDYPLDLSELQLAWFSGTPLPDAATMQSIDAQASYASQAGEGVTTRKSENNPTANPLDTGGTAFYATSLFAAGCGPILEEDAPYKNAENMAAVKTSDNSPVYRFLVSDPLDFTLDEVKKAEIFVAYNAEGRAVAYGGANAEVTDESIASGKLENYAVYPVADANGLYVCDANGNLATYDWSVPESKRLLLNFELENSTNLPSPAGADAEGTYFYDASATATIKKELMAGRGVHIEFMADTSRPNEQGEAEFINQKTWSHYTYDKSGQGKKVSLNHDVCIVGWDDNWGVENFNQGTYTNPETGAKVSRTPPAPGAWIVKNSWGAEDRGFPHEGSWGIVDANGKHTGYFYLSYYDMSLVRPTTYDFYAEKVDDNRAGIFVNQYDFMPSYDAYTIQNNDPCKIANVFTAEDNQLVRTLSVEATLPNTHAKLELYRLNEGATEPTDGELVDTIEADFAWGGYHRLQLPKQHYMAKGERFSVVATLSAPGKDGALVYQMPVHRFYSKYGVENYDILKDQSVYATGVVNPGESYLLEDEGWTDWSAMITKIKAAGDGKAYDYDNFALKAFADEDIPFVITKEVVNQQDVYYPGDKVRYRVTVTNEGQAPLEDVIITDSMADLSGLENHVTIAAGESHSIEYELTVTDADAQKGSIENEVLAVLEGVEGLEAKTSITVKCAPHETPAPQPTPTPTPSDEDGQGQQQGEQGQQQGNQGQQQGSKGQQQNGQGKQVSSKNLPQTGDEGAGAAAMLALAGFAAVACARRLRKDELA